MLVNDTPIEVHTLGDRPIYVKREDRCSPYPGPSFAKIRGVVEHIKNRPETVIGVLDTAHSKAGWAVSYVCRHLGKQCVNYWPRRVSEGPDPRPFQQESEKNGARLVELKAGRSSVLYHQARKHLHAETSGAGYLMPNALKLPESVEANAEEARRTLEHIHPTPFGTVVLSISSGTVAAGVMLGLREAKDLRFILHMGYSRSQEATRAYIEACAPGTPWDRVTFVDEGYGYADAAKPGPVCPFPTNPFYDGKAWNWLSKAVQGLEGPVLFWNIGD